MSTNPTSGVDVGEAANVTEARIDQADQDEARFQKFQQIYHVKLGRNLFRIELNLVVFILSLLAIWSVIGKCSEDPELGFMLVQPTMEFITKHFSWLFVSSRSVCVLLVVFIYFSKYSNLKLGRDEEKPEYNDFQYFTMLFATGIGTGLFHFGVAEPIFHYKPGPYGNRFWNRYTDNQRAQDAMNVTFLHWGVHAWGSFVIVGMLLSVLSYRCGLPLSIRSCFYPIIGKRAYGIIGDFIDTSALLCTMYISCTSLGFGTIQLSSHFHRFNIYILDSRGSQFVISGCITLVATASVITGIKLGIRLLSEISFVIGTFLLLMCFFYGDTWFFLNSYVQSCGYYLQTIASVGFHTEAFAQLNIAEDGKEAPRWFQDWTMYYWGNWTAITPLVGMFIAKISRGRTIKVCITYSMVVPILYIFLWFSVFGTAGIQMERTAAAANITCDSLLGGTRSTEPFMSLYRLSCRPSTNMWFDLMKGVFPPDLYAFQFVVSLAAIILCLVTTLDSASLVITSLTASGHPNPPITHRVFWTWSTGAGASLLLYFGDSKSLSTVYMLALIQAIPYTFLLNVMCLALWRVLQTEAGDLDKNRPQFITKCSIIIRLLKFVIALVAPWFSFARVYARINGHGWAVQIINMCVLACLFKGSVLLIILDRASLPGLAYIGATLYIGFVSLAARLRAQVREVYGINGNIVVDFVAVLILYPFMAVEMDDHTECMATTANTGVDSPLNGVTASSRTAEDEITIQLETIDTTPNNDNMATRPSPREEDTSHM